MRIRIALGMEVPSSRFPEQRPALSPDRLLPDLRPAIHPTDINSTQARAERLRPGKTAVLRVPRA